ncbi:MAG: hypothetical protein KDA51_13035, partial [Planctomycetales bacterium]|nr:hypothetical protein [Planctomycetales bacterium]
SGGQTTHYSYSATDRLLAIRQGSPSAEPLVRYEYHRLSRGSANGGQRSARTDAGSREHYQWDGLKLATRTNALGNPLARYSHANGWTLASSEQGAEYSYQLDALGTPLILTDEAAAIAVRYRLDPWGVVLEQTQTHVNPIGFTGYLRDTATDQLYAQARQYLPGVGRFGSVDPWEGDGLRPITLNSYLYGNGNPGVYTDPGGQCFWDVCVVEAAAIAALGITIIDYVASDRRDVAYEEIRPESFSGEMLAEAKAFSGAAASTMTFGYSDALAPGGQGAVEHTANVSGYADYNEAYHQFSDDDGDAILGSLYLAQGLTKSTGSLIGLKLGYDSARWGFRSTDRVRITSDNSSVVSETPSAAGPSPIGVGPGLDGPNPVSTGAQRFDATGMTAGQVDIATLKAIRRASGARGNSAGEISANADQLEFILRKATAWRRDVHASRPTMSSLSPELKGTYLHSSVQRRIESLNVEGLAVNQRLYGTSSYISPSTGVPYQYRIPDFRLGSTILDIKPQGTPLSGPQYDDFMLFGGTTDVRWIDYVRY